MSPGLNIIKGRSHGGKSAIIRALEWALLNNLRGDYFTSWFKGKNDTTSVGVEFDDGSYIIRKRDSTLNGYELSTKKDPIEAVHSDLPEEVSQITRMSEINIQTQDDQYFMIKETPGTVAKKLNELVGLSIIDEKLAKVTRLENENKAKKKVLETDLEEAEKDLKDLGFIDKMEEAVVSIEEDWEEYQEIIRKRRRLQELKEELIVQNGIIKDNEDWLTVKDKAIRIRKSIGELNKINEKRLRLIHLSGDLNHCESAIIKAKKILLAKKQILNLRSLIKQLSDLRNAERKLSALYSDMLQSEKIKARANETWQNLNKKRETMLKEHADEFCQSCGAHQSHWRNDGRD